MSRLLLIRHGQASFHADDYDQLSPTGHIQARRLGEWLRQVGEPVDAVYVGAKRRQQETERGVAAAFAAADAYWPEPRMLPGLDEVRFEAVVRQVVKERRPHDLELQELGRRFVTAADPAQRAKSFVMLAQEVCRHWLKETEPIPGAELWPEFARRAEEAFGQIRAEQGRGKTVAVFTSAGPISAFLQKALNCPPETAVSLWWRLANTSVTEFLFTESRLTLASFNSLPHLPQPGDRTYL